MQNDNERKTVSFLIPTYNEEANVAPLADAIIKEMEGIGRYDYEIVFIDNDSQDATRQIIRDMCSKNDKIKAIFNAKNFGQFNSPYYGILQTTGDCTITMVADFQDPVELIPKLIEEWENGYTIVMGQKTKGKMKKTDYALRSIFYTFMSKYSKHGYIKQATGFGLYDRSFLDVLRAIDDPKPVMRDLVAELGPNIKLIPYEQPERRAGKSSNNMARYYDAAVQIITNNTKVGIRLIIAVGIIFSLTSIIAAAAVLIYKAFNWNTYAPGLLLMDLLILIVLSLLILFVGIVGEYVLNINDYVKKRPLVVELERINFGKKE